MHLTESSDGEVTPTLLVVERASKSFAGVHALIDVSLDVRAGEILALVGENGAGKSTLLKALSGDHQLDQGRILVDGHEVRFGKPSEARRSGIRVIAQEPEIVPELTVAENIYLGELPRSRTRWFARRQLLDQVRHDIADAGFDHVLDPGTLGRRLSAAQRQLVEILRALTSGVKVLAFDEPTSSLSTHETAGLFELIRRLRDQGVGIIYVSHRMPEVFELADRIAVLRDGARVGVLDAAEATEDRVVRMMVGRDLSSLFRRTAPGVAGDVVLELRDVATQDVEGISFDVRAGEVVALAGLVGAGRTELANAISGDVPITHGELRLHGQPQRFRRPEDAISVGIGLAPEERKSGALLMGRSVKDNVSLTSLKRLSRWRFVQSDSERRLVARYVSALNVRTPSIEQLVRNLSGGNQQKVVLARWLATEPRLLILDEPTRGVDVGAKAEIYRIIDALATAGMALLVVSSELPEVLGLADRIVVMKAGRVTGELNREDASEERVMELAMADVPERRSGS
ncbi:MAG: sugar ABC transporter ATP-binding protein [Nocardioidaceae bacterium]